MSGILHPASKVRLAMAFCVLSTSMAMHGQANGKSAAGVPDDWSHHHVFFANPGTEEGAIRNGTHAHWLKITNDPRYLFQQWKQRPRPKPVASNTLDKDWSMNIGTTTALLPNTYPAKFTFDAIDSGACSDFVVFPTGVTGTGTAAVIIAFNNIYGHTTCTGSAANGAPTVYWAYNTGGTSILSPSFSNDATGRQIAYIQSNGAKASLVLLKWAAGPAAGTFSGTITGGSTNFSFTSGQLTAADVGAQVSGTDMPANDTIASITGLTTGTLATAPTTGHSGTFNLVAETAATPGVPISESAASYRACVAPCYTAIAFGDSHNDTNSSPFVDLVDDVLYVGDSSGALHKFTGVFNGTPTEVVSATAPVWPVAVGSNSLTSPVYDSGTSGNIFVADSGGLLYAIKASTAVKSWTSSKLTATSNTTGIVDSPIVDSTTEEVYVFVGNDANTSTAADCQVATGCAGIFQFGASEYTTNGSGTSCTATSNTAWATGTNCGVESALGTSITGNLAMYDGTFDHIYLTGTGTTGHIWSCPEHVPASGFEGPRLNQTNFSATGSIVSSGVISAAVNAITTLASANTTTAVCSPVTEIWGSNATTNDYIYLSVSNTGAALGTACTGDCLYNFLVATGGTATTPGTLSTPSAATAGITATGGTTGIVIDNTSSTTGESQIYYTTIGTQSCANAGTATTGNCAVQTSQTAP